MAITDWLNQSIEVEVLSGAATDAYGNPSATYVNSATHDARVEARSGKVEFDDRTVDFRGWRIFLEGDPGLDANDRIIYDGLTLEIVWIDPTPTGDGSVHHTVVWAQEVNP